MNAKTVKISYVDNVKKVRTIINNIKYKITYYQLHKASFSNIIKYSVIFEDF